MLIACFTRRSPTLVGPAYRLWWKNMEKKGSGLFCAKHPPGRSGKRVLTPFFLLGGAFYFSTTRLHPPDQASVQGTPRINSVEHDQDAGTITVRATVHGQPLAAEAYQWISGGQVVQTGPQLDYRQTDGVDNYARLELQGSGGTT